MNGRLLLGLPHDGKRYFDVKVRLLTIGDECGALELIADLGLKYEDNSPRAEKLRDLAYLLAQVEFVGIAAGTLTPAYLLDNLTTDDYVIIMGLIGELREKFIAAGESQADHAEAA